MDRHFSFAAIAFRIMGHLRSWRCTCGPHPQGRVNAASLRQAPAIYEYTKEEWAFWWERHAEILSGKDNKT